MTIWILIVAAVCSDSIGTTVTSAQERKRAAQRDAREATAGEQFVGGWIGTWDQRGGGAGPVPADSAAPAARGFELTLEKTTNGPLAGRVSVTGGPTYKASLKTVSFNGTKMTAKYDFPPDERAEIVLAVTFEGNSAKGSWTVIDKTGAAEGASGTLIVKRK
jgi:hypothetical protein